MNTEVPLCDAAKCTSRQSTWCVFFPLAMQTSTWSLLVNKTAFLFKHGELLLYKCRQIMVAVVKRLCLDPQNPSEETTVGTKTHRVKTRTAYISTVVRELLLWE